MMTDDTKTIKVLKRINAALQVKVDAHGRAEAEREARQAECAYCNNQIVNKSITGGGKGGGFIDIPKGDRNLRTFCVECDSIMSAKINYCPKCGRELREVTS